MHPELRKLIVQGVAYYGGLLAGHMAMRALIRAEKWNAQRISRAYSQGVGYLPGASFAVNATATPERVLSAEDVAYLAQKYRKGQL